MAHAELEEDAPGAAEDLKDPEDEPEPEAAEDEGAPQGSTEDDALMKDMSMIVGHLDPSKGQDGPRGRRRGGGGGGG